MVVNQLDYRVILIALSDRTLLMPLTSRIAAHRRDILDAQLALRIDLGIDVAAFPARGVRSLAAVVVAMQAGPRATEWVVGLRKGK